MEWLATIRDALSAGLPNPIALAVLARDLATSQTEIVIAISVFVGLGYALNAHIFTHYQDAAINKADRTALYQDLRGGKFVLAYRENVRRAVRNFSRFVGDSPSSKNEKYFQGWSGRLLSFTVAYSIAYPPLLQMLQILFLGEEDPVFQQVYSEPLESYIELVFLPLILFSCLLFMFNLPLLSRKLSNATGKTRHIFLRILLRCMARQHLLLFRLDALYT